MPRISKPMSVSHVAAYLDVSEQTVRNMIKKNEIVAFKMGGVYRIPQDAFEQYITDKINEVACPLPRHAMGLFR